MNISLLKLSEQFNCEIDGDTSFLVNKVSPLDNADYNSITFISNKKYLKQIKDTKAGAIVISKSDLDYCKENFESKSVNALICENPYAVFARISQLFAKYNTKNYILDKPNIHPSAIIQDNVEISKSAKIDALAVIDDGCIIGNNTFIGSGCYIGSNTVIGDNCIIYPKVCIYNDCILDDNIIIHSGTIIGSDGFGFAPDFKTKFPEWVKIPQIGIVHIYSEVEIGSNTTIDRATFGKTIIGTGTKIDNQVQIAHNVHIGNYCVIAGCTAIAGSSKIGNFCMIGGSSQISGHLDIADQTTISGGTSIIHSTLKGQRMTGVFPAVEHKTWEKNAAMIRQLHNLRKQIIEINKNRNK